MTLPRAVASRVTARRALLAITYVLLVLSCDSPLAPDDSAIARVEVDPATLGMIVGETRTITARAVDGSGSSVGNARFVWSTQDAAVATVSQAGIVTAVAPGNTQVAVSSGGKSALVPVTVSARPVSLVRVTPSTSTVHTGSSITLRADGVDATGNVIPGRPVAWSSSSAALATVSPAGVVTGVAEGNVTITATVDGVSGSALVTVEDVPVATVTVSPATESVFVGRSLQLTAITADSSGTALTGRAVGWTSSALEIATVSSTGLVIALAPGTATITATSEGKSGSAQITVSSLPVATVNIFPSAATMSVGRSAQLSAQLLDETGAELAGRSVAWASDQPTIVSISSLGIVTANAIGRARITATSEGKSGTSVIDVVPLGVASVTISPSSASVLVGATQQFTATARDGQGAVLPGRIITWLSGGPSVATVSQSGLVTAVGPGTALIIANSEGQQASVTLTVTAVTVAQVTVNPPTGTVQQGRSLPLVASIIDAGGARVPGKVATWTSSAPAVATVSPAGVVTAVTVGTATITATSDGVRGTAVITVIPVPVARVSVQPSAASVMTGAVVRLAVTLADSAANPLSPIGRTIAWTSSAPAIASVTANGVVTALTAGTATIQARSEGVSGLSVITITNVPVAKVELSPLSSALNPGGTEQFTATARDAAGNVLLGRLTTWTSSNVQVATVSSTGLATAVAVGTTQINASVDGVQGTAAVTITLAPVGSIVVSPNPAAVTEGQTTTLTATALDTLGRALTGRTFVWSSSNALVATVSQSGVVTAIAPGTSTITTSAPNAGPGGVTPTGTGVVNVGFAPVAAVSIVPAAPTVTIGTPTQLSATLSSAPPALPLSPVGRTLTWSVANPAVATISSTGMVTGLVAGSTTVTLTASSPGQVTPATNTVPLTVSIVQVARVVLGALPGTIHVGSIYSRQLTAQAFDASNNLLPGRQITWSTSAPGQLAVSPPLSSNGLATITAQGAPAAGLMVFASAPGASGVVSDTLTVTSDLVGISSVTVAPPSATLTPTNTQQLTATALDSAGNAIGTAAGDPLGGRTASWVSGNPAVGTVSATGLVTAVGAGTANITVSIGGAGPATFALTVVPPPVASVSVTAPDSSLTTGTTAQATVVARDAANNILSLTGRAVNWTTGGSGVATVSASGLITAVGAGTTTIGVTVDGVGPAILTVTVTPVPVASVTVTATDSSLIVGSVAQTTVVARDAANNILPLAGRTVVYTSTATFVATVSATGLVTALAPGSATIGATVDGVGPATFTVTALPVPVASVSVTAPDSSITTGSTVQANVVARDAANNILQLTGRTVVWASSDPVVASVSTSGLVTAVVTGTTSIGVTVDGVGPSTFTLSVTPPPVASVSVTAFDSSLTAGNVVQATVVARDAANNILPLTGRTVLWTSSATAVATVSASGLVTAVGAGSTTIGVTVDGVGPAAFVLSVAPAAVASVGVTAPDSSVTAGTTVQATAVARDASNNILPLTGRTVVWTSSATSVATISTSGLVTAVSAGTTVVGVTVDGVGPASFTLSVASGTVVPVPVASVSVTAPDSSVTTGTSVQAAVVARDAASNILSLTGRTVVWTTSDAAVATVSGTGLVASVAAGTATIGVTVDGVGPATFALSVSPPAVATVSVTAPDSSIIAGNTVQATVVARDAANNILSLTGRTVAWLSSSTGVATVSATGLVTAVGAGSSAIGVSVDGVGPATFNLVVAPVPVASVTVTAPDSSVNAGAVIQATVVARDAANNILPLAGRTVIWTSSSTGVASVSASGLVTSVGVGSTTISATVDGVGPASFVFVVAPALVASVSVAAPDSSLFSGAAVQASVEARDAANNILSLAGRTVVWTSSQPTVATVSATGLVTATAAGSGVATIGVTVDGVGPATFVVSVSPIPVASVSVTAPDSSIFVGDVVQSAVFARDAANNVLSLTGRAVVWTSGSPTVASVSTSGLVTAVGAGTSTIAVTVDGVGPAVFTLTVAPVPVASVSVTAPDSSLSPGDVVQATVVARDAANNILSLTGRTVTWSTTAPGVATSSASGLITAVSVGTTTIGVTVDGIGPATFTVNVSPTAVASVTVSAPDSSLFVGDAVQATVVARDAANNILSLTGRTVGWTSGSTAVATVSASGQVTAVGAGSSTIGVTVDGVGPATFTVTVVPVAVASVSVSAPDSSVFPGDVVQATVVARDAANNILPLVGRTVAWSSSTPSVATSSASGLITAVGVGTTTIGVTVDGIGPATFTLTVAPTAVASVSVTAPDSSVLAGTTLQATVVARDAANNVLSLVGRTVLWTSGSTAVATVSSSGLVSAVGAGSSTIGVTVDGVGPATFVLTVAPVPVASVSVTAPDSSLSPGDAVQAAVVARDAANNILSLAGRTVAWSSSTSSVATISTSGLITAVGVGTTTIGVTVDGVGPATFTVTVAPTAVASVSVTAPDSSVLSGTTVQATVVARDAANNILSLSGRTVVWTSSATAVATVSASGLVSAVGAGSSTIGVTVDGVGPATFVLTVAPVPVASVTVSAPDSSLFPGDAVQATVVARDAANNILPLAGRTVAWASSTSSVATISTSGLITAIGVGTTTIGVTVDGIGPATFTLTVAPTAVASVSVTAPDSSVLAGTMVQATVVARDAANNILSLSGRTVVWTSSATAVATVSASGLVSAVGAGSSAIGVTVDGVGPATFTLTVAPVPVASVSVTAPDSSLFPGDAVQATVVARDAANNILPLAGRTVAWASSTSSVATISTSGLITAVGVGTTTIGVTVDGIGPATFTLTVAPTAVASVSVTAPDSSVLAGTTVQATVVARDAANNILSLSGRTVVWTSSATAVATVSASGLVSAVGAGSSTIGVTVDGVGPATFVLTVAPVPVASVTVSAPDSSLFPGDAVQATVVARDAANNILPLAGRTVAWASSSPGVATISTSGLITAVGVGTTTIGVTVDGIGPATFTVTVAPTAVASVSVTAPDSSVLAGTTVQATVVARDAANNILSLSGRTVVWTSSATAVATVSASGLVSAAGAGSSTIGVTVDGVGPATFTLTVAPVPVASVSVTAPDSSLFPGDVVQATVVARDAANNVLPLAGRTVAWSSSATGVATVSSSGLITAGGVGTTTIGVTVDGVGPATFTVSVAPTAVASVSVTAPDSSLFIGSTAQATVVARDAANNILSLTGRTILWTSSATAAATVSSSGLVSAVGAGSSTIGVTVDGVGPATFVVAVSPVPVASVTVSAPDSSLFPGDAVQATVVARDAANNILPLSGRTVIWSSSAPGVATVSTSGLITAGGVGTTTIGVTVDGVGPATFTVSVAPTAVASVSVTAPDSSVLAGTTVQATVVARDAANNILSLSGRTVLWTSSATAVATISASGLVSTLGAGSSTIGVTVDGVGPATFTLTVAPVPVASVSVTAPDSSLFPGDAVQATVVARDAANNILPLAGRTVIWSSSSSGVATVSSSGLITAGGVGTTTIGVTVDGVGPATFAVSVAPTAVASVSVTAPDSSLFIGSTAQATVVARDAANNILSLSGRTILWTSSATAAATVSSSGLVSAVGAGSSTIGVTVDGVGPATFVVTVAPVPVASVTVTAPDSSIVAGSAVQATVVARDAANNILSLSGRTVLWSSSQTGVATISATGLISGVGPGSTTIGVTVDGVGPATFGLSVAPATVASVTVSAPDSSIIAGTSVQATVVARDAANNILSLSGRTVLWTSGGTGVATVSSSGLVSAIASGSSTIAVTVDGVGPASFTLSVSPVPVASVSVTAPDSSIFTGNTVQATVVARDAANNVLSLSGRAVVWTSSAPGVATVSPSGQVSAVGAGTSTIEVTVDGVGPASFVLAVAPAAVASVSVSAPDSSLTVGDAPIQATVVARDAASNILSLSGRTVVWTSGTPAVATVSASGTVSPVGAGTSTIGVTVDGVGPATFVLTVSPVPVASVSVTAPDSSVNAGNVVQATVVARDAANNILSLSGRSIAWSSSVTGVATVSASGLVSALSAGTTTIGVTVDGVGPATFTLNVAPVPVASVTVTAPDSSLFPGDVVQATVVARDAANNILPLAGRTVAWASSTPSVATSSASGLVTAVGVGSTTIGVTVDGVGPATFTVSVAPTAVASVSVTAPDSSLLVGTTAQATVVARDAANNVLSLSGRTILWTSTASGVATVSASGLVSAVGAGSTTIGVSVDGVGPATFALTVAPVPVASVSVSAPDSSVVVGNTVQATVVARDGANNVLSLSGRTILWTSSATGVATVSASGLVSAAGTGSTTIGVTVDGVGPATFTLNVAPVPVASVSVTASDSSLAVGDPAVQATVVARDAANNILSLSGRTIVWTSSATGVATVSASGQVTPVGAGSSTIGVTVDGVGPATFSMTVAPAAVASVTVSAPDSSIFTGTTVQATAVARDAANNILSLSGRTVAWTSSATGVATVSASGLVSAVGAGSTSIGVTVDGVGPATFALTVAPAAVASVTVSAPDSSATAGGAAVQATVVARDATNNILSLSGRAISWTSSVSGVATVSPSGLVTPVAPGTTTIGVTVDGVGPATFSLNVAPAPVASVSISAPDSSITAGSTVQATVVARDAANNVLSLSGRTVVWTSSASGVATVSATGLVNATTSGTTTIGVTVDGVGPASFTLTVAPAAVGSVSVSAPDSSLAVGDTPIQATVVARDAANNILSLAGRAVAWLSSATGVANISTSGQITPIGAGTTTISVTVDGVGPATFTLTVSPAAVASVSVTAPDSSIFTGNTVQATVVARDAANNVLSLAGRSVAWTSSSNGVATVSGTGLVTAAGPGGTTIGVTVDGVGPATFTLIVAPAAVATVSVSAPDSSAIVGTSVQGTVVARDAASNILSLSGRTVVWTSGSTAVATVSATGLVSAVAQGSSTIGVTVDGVGPATFVLTVSPVPVASVSVTAPDSSVNAGNVVQATVVARDAANNILSLSGRSIAWSSSVTGVATVSASGLVSALSAGTTTIGVTVDGVGPATFTLNVAPVPVASVTVTAPDSSLFPGDVVQATVVARDAANNILPLAGRTVAWASSTPSVATSSASGLVTAVGVGSTTIGVTVDGVGPATFTVSVAPTAVASVSVTAPDSSLLVGTTAQATVVARDAANNVLSLSGRTILWTSTASGVATVSASGLVSAVGAGSTTIGVSVDGVGPATFALTVAPVPVASVSVSAPDSSVVVGNTVQATVVARDGANNVLSLSGRTILWTSSATGVATVSASGLVSAAGTGSTTIGVTVDGVGPATFTLNVAPVPVASVSVTASDSSLAVGDPAVQATVVARDAANNILSLSGRAISWTSSVSGVATVSPSGLVTPVAPGTTTIGVTVDGVGPATFSLNVAPAPVASVSISAPDSTITAGNTVQATVVARDAANNVLSLSGRTVVWTSSASGVATVSATGLVNATTSGTTTIGVTVDGVGPASFSLTVAPAAVASVSVSAPDSSLTAGGTPVQASVVARDAANNVLSLTGRTVAWTSSATGIATVSGSGLVTPVSAGNTTIGVTVDGVGPATFPLAVAPAPVTSVSVTAPDSSLVVGDAAIQATAVARDAANNVLPLAGRTVIWTSSSSGVATVSASGLVTPVSVGSTTIGVTVDGIGPATFSLAVAPAAVSSVSVSASDSSLVAGGPAVQATVVARDAANNVLSLAGRTVAWTSSATGVATASGSGLVTPLSAGNTTIGVSVDGIGPATFSVAVAPAAVSSVSVSAPDSSLVVGGSAIQATAVARDAANNVLSLSGRTVVWTSSSSGVATVSGSGLVTPVSAGGTTIGVTVDGVGPATFPINVAPAAVGSVSVSAPDSSLVVGGPAVQSTVIARDAANNILSLSGRTIAWTSSVTGVATVSASGLVTPVSAGSTTIGVTVDGVGPATFPLNVAPAAVASVTVSAPDSSLTVGGSAVQSTVVARDAASNILSLSGRTIAWTSSVTGVATVSASGLVTPVSAGSTTIGVTVDGVGPATFPLNVAPAAVASVTVSAPDSSATVGGPTVQATAVARDAANNPLSLAGRTVVWTSSSSGVATVSASGLVTPVSAGNTTIGVTVDGVGPATFPLNVAPAAVASVTVSAPDSSLTVGGSAVQSTVVARDAANNILSLSGRTIAWTSSVTGVATVSASGLVTPVGAGSTTIGVTVDGVGPATFPLNVAPAAVASVTVSAPDSSLTVGDPAIQGSAVARDAANNVLSLAGRTVVWTSSASGVATVSGSGLVTPVSAGNATIGVTVDGIGPATFSLSVAPVPVASVNISATDSSLTVGGGAAQASVVARDAANNVLSLAGRSVAWTSSATAVATVSASGLVTPVSAGSATIGVTVDGIGPATFPVTVVAAPVAVASVSITASDSSLIVGGPAVQATAVARDAANNVLSLAGRTVVWASSTTAVATVSGSGLVTPVSAGSTTIGVTVDGVGPATFPLTVAPPAVASVSVSAPDSSATVGGPPVQATAVARDAANNPLSLAGRAVVWTSSSSGVATVSGSGLVTPVSAGSTTIGVTVDGVGPATFPLTVAPAAVASVSVSAPDSSTTVGGSAVQATAVARDAANNVLTLAGRTVVWTSSSTGVATVSGSGLVTPVTAGSTTIGVSVDGVGPAAFSFTVAPAAVASVSVSAPDSSRTAGGATVQATAVARDAANNVLSLAGRTVVWSSSATGVATVSASGLVTPVSAGASTIGVTVDGVGPASFPFIVVAAPVAVASVSITAPDSSLTVGDPAVQATVIARDAANNILSLAGRTVAWTSSATGVATVSATGLVTPVAAGSTTIGVTVDGVGPATFPFTVIAAPVAVASVSITAPDSSLTAGGPAVQATAVARDAANNVLSLAGRTVVWTSSASGVATVSGSGLVTPVGAGNANIGVSVDGVGPASFPLTVAPVAVASVTISAPDSNVIAGGPAVQATAVARDAANNILSLAGRSVAWTSSATGVATVSASGLVTPLSAGGATIGVSVDGVGPATFSLVVAPAAVASVAVSAPDSSATVGGPTVQATAVARDAANNVLSLAGRTVVWTSSSSGVATVSASGLVTPVSAGNTTIGVTVDGVGPATFPLTVVPAAVASVTVSAPDSSAIAGGPTIQATAVARDPANNILSLAGRTVGWTSSASGVATVSGSGLVTPLTAGSTTIGVSVDGVGPATFALTVAPVAVASVQVSAPDSSVTVGGPAVQATVVARDAANNILSLAGRTVGWTSSASGVATVSGAGLVTPVSAGSTTIGVTVDGVGPATFALTVVAAPVVVASVSVSAPDSSLMVGGSPVQATAVARDAANNVLPLAGRTVVWTSSATGVATVSGSGLVTPVSAGNTTIGVTVDGVGPATLPLSVAPATVASVTVSAPDSSAIVGGSAVQATAVARDAANNILSLSGRVVAWTSSATAVATVSASGLVTPVSAGSSTIGVTVDGVGPATFPLTVAPAAVASVSVSAPDSSLTVGGPTLQATVVPRDAGNNVLSLTGRTVVWTSSASGVATVSASGLLTPVASGSTTIGVTVDGIGPANFPLTVAPAAVASVSVSAPDSSLTAGDPAIQAAAVARDAANNVLSLAGRTVVWTSSASGVATVTASGLVTPISAGNATIGVTVDGIGPATFALSVAPVAVASVQISAPDSSLAVGDQAIQATAVARDAANNGLSLAGRVVAWTSSSTGVATVSGSGLIAPVSAGSTTISVTVDGVGPATFSLTVSATAASSSDLTPTPELVARGDAMIPSATLRDAARNAQTNRPISPVRGTRGRSRPV